MLPDVPTAVSSPLNAQGAQLNVRQTRDGLYIVAVQGATASDTFTLRAYTAEGRLLGTHTFHAATVVSLPRISGTVLFSVEGTNFRQAKKLNVR